MSLLLLMTNLILMTNSDNANPPSPTSGSTSLKWSFAFIGCSNSYIMFFILSVLFASSFLAIFSFLIAWNDFLPFLIVLGGIRHVFFIMTKLPIWETTEGYRGLFLSHLIIEILRKLFAFDIILIMYTPSLLESHQFCKDIPWLHT